MNRLYLIPLLLALFLCAPLSGDVHANPIKDPPHFARLANYDALPYGVKTGTYDSYTLWMPNATMPVEGKLWFTTYAVKADSQQKSDLEIIVHYKAEVLKLNGSIEFDGRDDSERRTITGKFINKDKKTVWMEATAWNGGTDYHLTVVEMK